MKAARNPAETLFTPRNPLGPSVVSDRVSIPVLRAIYDTRVHLHLRSKDNPPTFIVGRRGSGKTALLLSREFEPRNLVVRLSAHGVFSRLQAATELLAIPLVLSVEGVAELWETLLWAPIIGRLVAERHDCDPDRAFQVLWEETAALRQDVAGSDSRDDAALDFVTTRLIEHVDQFDNVVSLEKLSRDFRLSRRPWKETIEAAKSVLDARDTPVFVLIDSLENIGDHIERIEGVLRGLFHLVGRLGLRIDRTYFRIQCCFPSELWPVLDRVSANPIKDFSGRMVLRWTWQDLLRTVGARLHMFLTRHYPELLRGLPDDGYLTLLDRVIVPELKNRAGLPERSVAYVLRHTQLLPRQVLYIFNEALHRAIATTGRPVVDGNHILETVTEAEATLCPEVFSAHHFRHPKAHDVARRLIPYLPFRFDDAFLHRMCNQAGIRREFGLDYREVREMFTDVGIIGRLTGESERYLKAEFAYAAEGQMILSPDEEYCLHPLFVREYNARGRVSSPASKPVYPSGTPEPS
ncbi:MULTISPECIES: P-loop ATPase, Sll1717 family [unclassified Nonomuraea]|uniref:P-loop ATPase, Sll1717 family n=1 Tax=unclassified Nonomuraea TaxID=2593643 RepID=UPI00343E125E